MEIVLVICWNTFNTKILIFWYWREGWVICWRCSCGVVWGILYFWACFSKNAWVKLTATLYIFNRLHSEEAGTTSTPRLNQLHTLLFQSVQSFSAFLTFVSTGPNLCYLVFALYLVPQPVVVHLVPLRCSLCLVHFSRVSPWYFQLLSLSCLPLVSMVEPSV